VDTAHYVLRSGQVEAVRLPDTPDTVDSYVPQEAYAVYADAYNDVAEWCGATLIEGVDSRDIYYYYIETEDYFASDGNWIVKSRNGKITAYSDKTFNEIFMKLDQ
jgi:hypothetical protein